MLEDMRTKTGSIIIWVLFAIIIAAFVLFFGPQSNEKGGLGCGTSTQYSIQVNDEEVGIKSWRFAYNALGGPSDRRRPLALEGLLEREILAQAADKLDFLISDKEIDKEITAGQFYALGDRGDGTRIYFEEIEDGGSFFNYEYLQRFVQNLGLSNMKAYRAEQKRELLAYLMKQEIIDSAYVSEEEARSNYIASHTTISAEYVKFEVRDYRTGAITEAQVEAYAASNADKLKTKWESVSSRWGSDKSRARIRIIKVAKVEAKAEPQETEEGSEETEKPAVDSGRIAIDKARAEILAGASFAKIAEETSSDRSASLGGNAGWRGADSLGYGQEVTEAAKGLEIGKVSEVVEVGRFYYLVLVEERSDKGLSFDQKKFDLATSLAPEETARTLAKEAAEAALAQAATTPLSELFEKAAPRGLPPGLEGIPPELLKNMSPEDLQKLMRAMPGSESGALITEGRNRKAQTGGTTPEVVGAPAAGALPAPAVPTAPAVVSTAAPAVPAPAVPAPGLQTINRTTRNRDFIAGVGRSAELVDALFGELAIGALAPKVYEVEESDGFVVVQLTDRSEADMEEFKEQSDDLRSALAEGKGNQILATWVADQCQALKKAGKITPNRSLLIDSNSDKPLPYEPCSLLSPRNPPGGGR